MAQSDNIEDEVGDVFLDDDRKKLSPKKEQLKIKIPILRPQYVSPIPDMKSTMRDNNYTHHAKNLKLVNIQTNRNATKFHIQGSMNLLNSDQREALQIIF